MTSTTRINPKEIVFSTEAIAPVPKPSAVAVLDMEAIEYSVWQMLAHCEATNQNERLIIAITALIEAGVNIGPRIIGAAKRLGFKRAHAGAILGKSTGADPTRHRWYRDESSVYHMHAFAGGKRPTDA